MDIIIPLLVIISLILINAIFVAAEFAIVGVPRASIDRLAQHGNRVAIKVSAIINNPILQDRYIATAQLGITAASLGLGMYGEKILAGWILNAFTHSVTPNWFSIHAVASVIAIVLLTYFHIVLGEMVPKSLSLLSAERTVLWISPLMQTVQFILFPLVIILNAIGNGILLIFGIRRELSTSHYHTPQEINYLVRESEEGGLLKQDSGRVLHDLFEFGELTAAEVMVPRVHVRGIPMGAYGDDLLNIVRNSRHTRYPVYQDDLDHITGMIHIKDIFRITRSFEKVTPANIRQLPYLPETADLDAVLGIMRQQHAQIAVVMDEHGGTAGIITLEDLFEEVVGDIEDGVTKEPDILPLSDGSFQVIGTVRIDEVGEEFGIEIEHDEVDTVSGLILSLLDRPPVIGDAIVYRNLLFEVMAVEGHGVKLCRVTRNQSLQDTAGE